MRLEVPIVRLGKDPIPETEMYKHLDLNLEPLKEAKGSFKIHDTLSPPPTG